MNAPIVTPIDIDQQTAVVNHTHRTIDRASELFAVDLPRIPVTFDLSGHTAGMYMRSRAVRKIRFNPWIFAKFPEANWHQTIPHEVAHYAVDMLFPGVKVKPHGPEWKNVMIGLGQTPTTTAKFDVSGIPMRRVRRYTYYCVCGPKEISAIRHNRVVNRGAQYICPSCRTTLCHREPYAKP